MGPCLFALGVFRLSLRAELRGARETLFEVPEEGWLSSDGLDAEERRFLEKVDKLLALSNSSNEHEAALAMERAQALLETRGAERHRDRMGANGSGSRRADGSGPHGSTPFVRLTLSLGVNQIGAIHKSLAGLLAAHYQVRAVWGREYDVAESTEAVSLTLLGRREHVLLAEHVFDFLDHQVDVLWQRARRERDLAGAGRLSFQLGLLAGFRGKLAAARSARTTADVARGSDTTALLRLERDDLEAFVSQVYPNLTSLGRGSVSLKADVFEAGKDEGGRLSVHTPVASREDPGAGVRRALTS